MLSFFSKLLEKVVMSQLLDHLNTNEVWPRFQSTYRARHSTEKALLRILNKRLAAIDDGQLSLLTLQDVSAAIWYHWPQQSRSSIGSNRLSAYKIRSFVLSVLSDQENANRLHFWLQFKSTHSPLWCTPRSSSRSHTVSSVHSTTLTNHWQTLGFS